MITFMTNMTMNERAPHDRTRATFRSFAYKKSCKAKQTGIASQIKCSGRQIRTFTSLSCCPGQTESDTTIIPQRDVMKNQARLVCWFHVGWIVNIRHIQKIANIKSEINSPIKSITHSQQLCQVNCSKYIPEIHEGEFRQRFLIRFRKYDILNCVIRLVHTTHGISGMDTDRKRAGLILYIRLGVSRRVNHVKETVVMLFADGCRK
ncbi:hypothetical protein FGO68_gene5928 [Halteria grandinella]|uniref:Uncharacterized protein n=1 Tax=Halteria grandinella TaxID=5974 RepID=A0A8J8SUS8_HALGN|nr:hypothetical protein FGO68_gene5928 [Halteria grandinella]